MKQKFLVLTLIIILAAFLRFWKLAEIPPGINWDEASIGFNGYMISKIGRDEFGQKFPLAFRSYDDYKAPLTVYLSALTFKLMPINEWTLRFPSAFLGTLTVLLTYFLTKELFRKTNYLAIIAALSLAISPWHLHFSRSLSEANLAVFFITLGALFFLKFIAQEGSSRQVFYGFIASLSFSLSLYSYHSARGFVPLLISGSVLVFFKKLRHKKKYLLFVFLLLLIFSLPLLSLSLSPQAQRRLRSVSIFEQERIPLERSVKMLAVAREKGVPLWIARIIHNRRLEYLKEVIVGYFSHFTPNFLFLKPGEKVMYRPAPDVGLLYLFELPFLLMGIYYLFKNRPEGFFLLIFWFLIAPIPASFTTNLPYVVRTQNFLPVLQIFIAYGVVNFWQSLKRNRRKLLFGVYGLLFTGNVFYFLHQYFVHAPLENSQYWQYGYRELVETIKREKNYDKVVVFVRQKGAGRETILEKAHGFVAFYFLPEPELYLEEGGTQFCQYGLTGKMHFGKFYFEPLSCFGQDLPEREVVRLMGENNLVVIDAVDFEEKVKGKLDFKIIKSIKYLNGEPAVELIRT